MEFENYERELKYLIKKNEKYTSKQFLEFLFQYAGFLSKQGITAFRIAELLIFTANDDTIATGSPDI